MYKLYGFPMSPNARRVHACLEELGVPYEYVTVDLMQGAQKKPEYLALNPNGKVPTLVDGEHALWESHAILLYLAQKHPEARLGGATAEEQGEIARWLFLNAAHLGPALAGVFAHTVRLPEAERVARIADTGRAEASRIFGVLDAALAGREHLACGRLTLADIALLPSLAFAPMLGFDLSAHPNVAGWVARLLARPALKKALG